MKRTALITLLLLVLGACESYQPSEANCFSFVSRGPAPFDCNFEALDGAEVVSPQ